LVVAGTAGWPRRWSAVKLGVLAHPVAVAADVDDVAMVNEPVDERAGHDVVAEDLAPLVETLQLASPNIDARCPRGYYHR